MKKRMTKIVSAVLTLTIALTLAPIGVVPAATEPQSPVAALESMAAEFESNLAAAQAIIDTGGFLVPVASEDEPSAVIANLESMAAEFEKNLEDAQEIMDAGGFLADIGEVAEGSIPISDRAELEAIKNNLSGTYHLTADIDLSGTDWVPIGSSSSRAFTGVFDGQGHKISNLTITGDDYEYNGLFGYVENATIKNIGLVDTHIDVTSTSSRTYAGGIAGYAPSSSSSVTIENCYNTGSVTASSTDDDSYAGGILGYAYFDDSSTLTIENCYNTGDVSASDSAGGIVGYAPSSSSSVTIENCYNTGDISASGDTGGIFGYARDSTLTIENCYNTGDISAFSSYYSYAGGLAGSVYSSSSVTIESCYNTGDVTASSSDSSYAGGIAGSAGAGDSSSLMLAECYKTGEVSTSS
ncbi:MAG: hypothetical protein LBD85_02970, partial [Oscillospiraceae bacterium]|nr:hypothetical protein [Oscillospiraceae bacterium]